MFYKNFHRVAKADYIHIIQFLYEQLSCNKINRGDQYPSTFHHSKVVVHIQVIVSVEIVIDTGTIVNIHI